MSRLIISLIRGYQLLLSPILPVSCRFHPCCSNYCCEALKRYGLFHGLLLSTRRIIRCHPWNPGGYDPLP